MTSGINCHEGRNLPGSAQTDSIEKVLSDMGIASQHGIKGPKTGNVHQVGLELEAVHFKPATVKEGVEDLNRTVRKIPVLPRRSKLLTV